MSSQYQHFSCVRFQMQNFTQEFSSENFAFSSFIQFLNHFEPTLCMDQAKSTTVNIIPTNARPNLWVHRSCDR